MDKKTIMLACAAGMSTSLLVTKMKQAADAKGLDIDIFAVSVSALEENIKNKKIDIVLLGPQVRFMKSKFEPILSEEGISLDVINMKDYGMMNGEKVLNSALELL